MLTCNALMKSGDAYERAVLRWCVNQVEHALHAELEVTDLVSVLREPQLAVVPVHATRLALRVAQDLLVDAGLSPQAISQKSPREINAIPRFQNCKLLVIKFV